MNFVDKYEITLSNVISDVLNELWEDIREEEKVKIIEHIESIRFHYSNISKLSALDEEDAEYQKMISSQNIIGHLFFSDSVFVWTLIFFWIDQVLDIFYLPHTSLIFYFIQKILILLTEKWKNMKFTKNYLRF